MSTSPESRGFLNSLEGRFISASLLCLPLFIAASGLLLENAYKENLLSTQREQLQTQLYILLGSAEVQDGTLWLPEQLPEPRYAVMDSGLYAKIHILDPDNPDPGHWRSRWRSASARLLEKELPESNQGFTTNEQAFHELPGYFRFRYDLVWEEQSGDSLPMRFHIYHSRDSYTQSLKRYRKQLWYGLSLLAMGLLTIQVLIMRWGLRPLKTLVRDLRKLPQQMERQLKGNYPAEIEPVTNSLNEVLHNEQRQRERYQNTLSDLAHSLKTPLAIMQGELHQSSPDGQIIAEQLDRMNTIIRHQLARAVLQTNQKLHKPQLIRPVVERLCQAMGKVYREKSLLFDLRIDSQCHYSIESQDLFEMLGNLIENACKYGNQRIQIRAQPTQDTLLLYIDDDGEGIAEDKLQAILQRGARADSARPGQGIGLAISADIVSAYGGSLEAGRSTALGGASFQIRLPIV